MSSDLQYTRHPDGTTSDLRPLPATPPPPPPAPPAAAAAAGRRPAAWKVYTGAGVLLTLTAVSGGVLLLTGGPSQDTAAQAAPTMPVATEDTQVEPVVEDIEVISGTTVEPRPLRIRARVSGGEATVRARLRADVAGEARWRLWNPAGDRIANELVAVNTEGIILRHDRLRAGEYRWQIKPTGTGRTVRGTVTVTAPPARQTPTPDTPPAPAPAPSPTPAPPPPTRTEPAGGDDLCPSCGVDGGVG